MCLGGAGSIEELDDAKATDHWENIQSTNWNTVRWKPPPPRDDVNDPHIGWRAEFRSMEVQLTDFENAAFSVFIVLVTRVILAFDLNLYLPLSRVDENMNRAHARDAVRRRRGDARLANISLGSVLKGGAVREWDSEGARASTQTF